MMHHPNTNKTNDQHAKKIHLLILIKALNPFAWCCHIGGTIKHLTIYLREGNLLLSITLLTVS